MEQPVSANLSWGCPSCGRRVPRRVGEMQMRCRRRHRRPTARATIDRPTPAPQQSSAHLPPSPSWLHRAAIAACFSRRHRRRGLGGLCEALAAALSTSRPIAVDDPAPSSRRRGHVMPTTHESSLMLSRTSSAASCPRSRRSRPDSRVEPVSSSARSSADQRTCGPGPNVGHAASRHAMYGARVMTVSPGSDLALLQVFNADPEQPVLSMGSVSHARVGQEVIAVGSALACSRTP